MTSGETTPLASVLVVDDTVENLRLLSNLLNEHGYEARPVTTGKQALQAVEHDPPDLILLDISMPEMDGYEVCRRLKASALSKDIPVIFLTALTETAHKVRAFEAGGVDYITKPFQVDEVLARVATHLALRQAQSELTASYERLRKLEQLRDDLVHMIVHDMASPLATLKIRLDVLDLSGDQLDELLRDDIHQAHQAVSTLMGMTRDLLDVSRLEQGKMPIKPAVCDLTRLAVEVRDALAAMDRERTIEVESAESVKACCDGDLVRRVIENLVSNGIHHTPPGTPVRISVVRTDDTVRVAVHDQGPGIDPGSRQQLFEKFGTVQARRDRSYQSIGLGLAFCKLAVEAHGGTIGVEQAKPLGNTFWFDLPAGDPS